MRLVARMVWVTYSVCLQFPVRPNIEQSARCVVGSGTKGIAVGEELDGIDIRVVRGEGLHALLLPNVPQLRESIASTGDELVVIERIDAQAHHVTEVIGEFAQLLAGLDIPKHAGHVTRRCEDPSVVDEAAA